MQIILDIAAHEDADYILEMAAKMAKLDDNIDDIMIRINNEDIAIFFISDGEEHYYSPKEEIAKEDFMAIIDNHISAEMNRD